MEILIIHAAATWFMVGLIWIVQVVHYPLFALVGAASFTRYESAHTRRMGAVLLAPAVVEVAMATVVFVALPGGVSRAAALTGGAMLALIWMLTAVMQVRQHRVLAGGFDEAVHRRLVGGNWWRTALWSGRGLVAAVMLV